MDMNNKTKNIIQRERKREIQTDRQIKTQTKTQKDDQIETERCALFFSFFLFWKELVCRYSNFK